MERHCPGVSYLQIPDTNKPAVASHIFITSELQFMMLPSNEKETGGGGRMWSLKKAWK